MRLGYLYSRYPVISQTFCDTEMLALEKLGFSLEVGSIYPPLTSLRHAHAARLRAPIHYAPPQQVLRISEKNAKTRGHWPKALVDLHEEKYGWRYKPAQRARNALYFADLFTRLGIDHFHVHFANRAAHTALFLKEIAGLPFSITAHGQDFMVDLGNDELLQEICAAASFIAVETNYSGQLLAQRCPDSASKIYRVFNGIDLENFPPPLPSSQNKPVRILSVGRLVPFKGFDQLIDACAELARRNLDFSCEIIGDGPERDRLQDKIDKHQLKSRVALTGSLPREIVFEKMRSSDIFALASMIDRNGASDVFPTVILEAMTAARPVVATQVAGIPESVLPNETGLLVSPGDGNAMAEALAQLIVDLSLRQRFGSAGRARVEQHFDIKKTITPLVELLRGATSNARPKPAPPPKVKQIGYLIDRWPDPDLPALERELKEMRRRNIAVLPIVCEFDSQSALTPEQEAVAPTMEFLPDAMVIEAEWKATRVLAQRLEDAQASDEERVPGGFFLRQARFALSLCKWLAEKNISHLHATSSRALVCAMILKHLVDLSVSATIEARPPVSSDWIKFAFRQCRGGRLTDRRLIRRRGSSFMFDKAASRNSLQAFAKKIGIDLTGPGSFWQEWSELLVRWSRERAD
jgi:glycosyltransferase involved in cell wall biosynthesis